MADTVPPNPPVMDGGKEDRSAWRRVADTRFVWVAPSPSPAEVAELERHFPEVIQVPTEVLEVEATDWERSAIIARSFLRWVPPDVIIREFRRAGIPGEIEAVSLAHRCFIFKFSDLNGRKMALERPWVVNGQPIATEKWSPEFIPSPDAVATALLWVRLPNLPLEFWAEEILSSILAPAGFFVCSDSSTKLKNRGGFARACVRVDLRRPLRPGVRIRGTRAPFWQQYQYEHLEGICPRCGSLHLNGPCGPLPETESSSGCSKFGPWMMAVRQRRPAQSSVPELRRKVNGVQSASKVSSTADGWTEPVKVARRRPKYSSSTVAAPGSASVPASGKTSLDIREAGSVPVEKGRAGLSGKGIETENNTLSGNSDVQFQMDTESSGVQVQLNSSLTSENPFALLGSDKWAGRPTVRKDAHPGPSKRARASESEYHRITSKNEKRKGKMPASGIKRVQDNFIFSASSESGRGTAVQVNKDGKSTHTQALSLDGETNVSDQPNQLASRSHDSMVSSLKEVLTGQGQEMQIRTPPSSVDESAAVMVASHPVVGTSIAECLPDTAMVEDKAGAIPHPTLI